MEDRMSYRGARRLHVLLMSWLTLTFVTGWLPFVRGVIDGPSYQWGAGLFAWNFSGAGTGGDFWYAALMAMLGLVLLAWGWRRPNGAFRIVLVLWLVLMLANTLYNVTTAPEAYRFQGDTLGVDISLVVIAPAFAAAMAGLAFYWFQFAPVLPVPPFGRTNVILIAIAALLLPIQYGLLSAGSGQDMNDVLGVLLTMAGWALLSAGLGVWRNPAGSAQPIQAL
jgi:hypothetical protein